MRYLEGDLRPLSDKAAIGLSLLCALHCLALPVVIALAPAVASLAIADESFHLWMVLVVVPVSAYALLLGCRRHGHLSIAVLGVVGLLVLVAAVIAGHDLLGEAGERAMTLSGASLIALSHLLNFRSCRRAASCDCAD